MPGTDNVTVWVAAQTGMVAAMSTKETNSFFMMNSLSVEKGQYIGKADCDQHERGYYPENQLVDGMNPGNRADFVRLARVCGPRSEEHTSELQSLMRIPYAVFCLKQKTTLKSTAKPTRTDK